MITNKETKCKEIADRLKKFYHIPTWKVDEALENNEHGVLKHWEEVADRKRFNDLSVRAKVNCMEQFINIIVPYADYDDCPDNDLEYVVCDIEEWVGDQFYFDENGDWYDEGRMVR